MMPWIMQRGLRTTQQQKIQNSDSISLGRPIIFRDRSCLSVLGHVENPAGVQEIGNIYYHAIYDKANMDGVFSGLPLFGTHT